MRSVNDALSLGLALTLPLVLAVSCSPSRIDDSGSDAPADAGAGGGTDGSVSYTDPCVDHPNSNARCWRDGVKNGPTRNPTCPVASQTSLSGVVKIPAGTLPLANAKIYIASTPAPDDPKAASNLPAIDHGPTCDTCDKIVPPDSLVTATTDINGQFTLHDVPVPPDGKAMYLVIRLGKWRRAVRIEDSASSTPGAAHISRCGDNQLDPELTRLPRNQQEGDIPRIALSTGSYDALECILRGPKLGLSDSEFTTEKGSGSVNMYAGNGASRFSAALGGAAFTAAKNVPNPSWWDDPASWNKYDIVMLSCEGAPDLNTKSVTARINLQNYINAGGRVFASHYHNGWIASGPSPLSSVATFPNGGDLASISADLVTTLADGMPFTKGVNMKQWLTNAGALTGMGQLPIVGAKNTIGTINTNVAQPWVTYGSGKQQIVQYFSFYAPIGVPAEMQCGEMVFTDLHMSSADGAGDSSSNPFPSGCVTNTLSAQEKALIFMLFDLTNCVQPVIG